MLPLHLCQAPLRDKQRLIDADMEPEVISYKEQTISGEKVRISAMAAWTEGPFDPQAVSDMNTMGPCCSRTPDTHAWNNVQVSDNTKCGTQSNLASL